MFDTKHFHDMIKERDISIELVDAAVSSPDVVEDKADGTRHYLKKFENLEGRWLRVIVNIRSQPKRRITAFFDRRLRMQHENKTG